MLRASHSSKWRYGLALVMVCLAAILQRQFNSLVSPGDLSFFFIIVSVLITAWFGGIGPGILSTILALFLIDFHYFTPRTVLENTLNENIWLAVIGFAGFMVSFLCGLRARSMSRLRVRARQQQAVAAFGNLTLQSTDTTQLLNEAIRHVTSVLQVRHALLLQLCPDGEGAYMPAGAGWDPPVPPNMKLMPEGGESLFSFSLRILQPVLSHDLLREQRFQCCSLARAHGLRSCVSALIRSQELTHGIIAAYAHRPRFFTQEDLDFLQAMAQTLALALERRQAEQERASLLQSIETLAAQAQDSLAQFQATVGSMHEGVTIFDGDGGIHLMNPAALRMLDVSDPALCPCTMDSLAAAFELRTLEGDLLPPEAHPHVRVLRGETFTDAEIQIRNHRTARYWIASCTGSPVRDAAGRTVLAVQTMRDITRQKESEAERKRLLRQVDSERAKLNAIFENAPEAIVVVDEDCRIIMANPAAATLFERPIPFGEDYETHTALHICSPEGDPIPPRQLPLTRAALDGVVLGNVELAIDLPSGGRRAILMNTSPIFNAARAASGAIAVFQDVTASREAERERQRLLTQVQDYSTELRQHARELSRINSAKDEFLAMLAHELRNPLAPIVNSIHIMRSHGLPQDTSLQRSIEMIERQTQHMTRLLDDLLDVARITSGKIALQLEELDFSTVVRQAVDTWRAAIEAYQHSLRLKLPAAPVWVRADSARLEQVVGNLLSNAAKYTRTGGWIEIEIIPNGREAELHVRDNGIGIAREMLTRIFELFSQAAPTIDRSLGGLGIGLTMVKRLVELHGGRAEASSAGLGHGSDFIIHLPLAAAPAAHAAHAAPAPQEPAAGLRVLIVEDNTDTALAMSEVLELWGHEVRLAYDGPGALEVATIYQPEVILLDIGLPVMDGYQVAQNLRRDPRFQQTVLIAITGYGQDEDIQRSHDAGINHHFTKPINLPTLREILAGLCHPPD